MMPGTAVDPRPAVPGVGRVQMCSKRLLESPGCRQLVKQPAALLFQVFKRGVVHIPSTSLVVYITNRRFRDQPQLPLPRVRWKRRIPAIHRS